MGIIKIIFKVILYTFRSVFISLGVLWLLSLMQNKVGEFLKSILSEIIVFITTKVLGYAI